MKRESILYEITKESKFLSKSIWPIELSELSNNSVFVSQERFLEKGIQMITNGSSYLIYELKNRKVIVQEGINEVLGYSELWKDVSQFYNKLNPVSDFFARVQLHILLHFNFQQKINLPTQNHLASGLILFHYPNNQCLLARRDLNIIVTPEVDYKVSIGEIITPICTINTEMLSSIFPLLSVMKFSVKDKILPNQYLQQLINESELFSQQQINILKAMKTNNNYQHPIRKGAQLIGVHYEALKTQMLRIREKTNQHFKTDFKDSTSAIRFIILSNLV
jgi:hypothetical protein